MRNSPDTARAWILGEITRMSAEIWPTSRRYRAGGARAGHRVGAERAAGPVRARSAGSRRRVGTRGWAAGHDYATDVFADPWDYANSEDLLLDCGQSMNVVNAGGRRRAIARVRIVRDRGAVRLFGRSALVPADREGAGDALVVVEHRRDCSVLFAMLVRGQLAILIVAYLLAALFLAWTSEPVTRWRAGWSTWDWVGFVVLTIGAVIVFSASVGAFSQSWLVATGYYRHRMIVYGSGRARLLDRHRATAGDLPRRAGTPERGAVDARAARVRRPHLRDGGRLRPVHGGEGRLRSQVQEMEEAGRSTARFWRLTRCFPASTRGWAGRCCRSRSLPRLKSRRRRRHSRKRLRSIHGMRERSTFSGNWLRTRVILRLRFNTSRGQPSWTSVLARPIWGWARFNSAKRFADAIPPLETYEKMAPDSPTGHYQLAVAYAGAGRKEDANREAALQRQSSEALEAVKRKAAIAQEKQTAPAAPPSEQK